MDEATADEGASKRSADLLKFPINATSHYPLSIFYTPTIAGNPSNEEEEDDREFLVGRGILESSGGNISGNGSVTIFTH